MSTSAYSYSGIAQAVINAVTAAWGAGAVPGTLTIQEDEEPLTIQGLPFVNVKVLEIMSNPKGLNATVQSVDDLYRFEVILYFLMPAATGGTGGLKARLKANYMSLLREKLQTGDGFGGAANFPYVTGADFRDLSPRPEGSATLRVRFECHGNSDYFTV
jgi:hypothetical protein